MSKSLITFIAIVFLAGAAVDADNIYHRIFPETRNYGRRQPAAGNLSDCKSRGGEKSVNAEEELSVLKEKIEKMKETYKGAQDYEYENYKKYNEEGNTVAANRALGKSYAFEAIYTYIKNM